MLYAKYILGSILVTASRSLANPLGHSARSHLQAGHTLSKRTLYDVDDLTDEGRRTFLRDAQKEAVDVAKTALDFFDDPRYADILPGWFGNTEGGADDARGVLTNFVGANDNGEGAVFLSDVKVWQDDYHQIDGVNFCDINQNGRTGTAYFKRRGGRPGMHFCDKAFGRLGTTEFLAAHCGIDRITTDNTTRAFRGSNVLHEFMHFPKVGRAQ
jgi:hypothetical protein